MPRVVHFEFGADNPERAAKFYRDVFNWKIESYPGPTEYLLVDTGKEDMGINGAITKRQKDWDISNTIGVESVDEYIERIEMHGGEVITEKMTIPGIGYMAYFKDTEGNIIGIIEPDMSAK